MAIKKYLDWRSWVEGLYLSWIKTLTSTMLGYVGTNAVESMGVVDKIGLSWKQAVGVGVSVTIIELLRYLNTKPLPDTVTTEENTTIIQKP